jgi:hypothetical protein
MSSKLFSDFEKQSEDYKITFLPKTKIEKKNIKMNNKGENSIENNINENRLPDEFNDLSYDNNKEE